MDFRPSNTAHYNILLDTPVGIQSLAGAGQTAVSVPRSGAGTRTVLSLLTVTDAPLMASVIRSRSRESSEEMESSSAAESSGSTQAQLRRFGVHYGGAVQPAEPRRPGGIGAGPAGVGGGDRQHAGEELNSLVSGQSTGLGLSLTLSQEQIQLMKDIRRRGTDKVAAQHCRQRKIDDMSHLEREIYNLRQELSLATARRDEAARQCEVFRAALAGPSVIQALSSSKQTVHVGGQQHHHAFVLVANVQANANASGPLRKRKKDA
ncbi:uncharacterized protein LOC129594435 [Paramacrobiotus metropolitanus]|uniref:uncharacterized protein LOC129594435 n=1 Tax=Paramacrobiotus metropolitanus TaxID=2943436 RepID=UPI0024461E8D|nr:uncharacterized protein LOC129594435 [Paramacrobiotus metropolitanus]XP_055347103.1 uncharacterized protein LOC129594435 [Paramacrobiotus metropolitanus]